MWSRCNVHAVLMLTLLHALHSWTCLAADSDSRWRRYLDSVCNGPQSSVNCVSLSWVEIGLLIYLLSYLLLMKNLLPNPCVLIILLHWLRVHERIRSKVAVLVYKVLHGCAPSFTYVADLPSRRGLRSSCSILVTMDGMPSACMSDI